MKNLLLIFMLAAALLMSCSQKASLDDRGGPSGSSVPQGVGQGNALRIYAAQDFNLSIRYDSRLTLTEESKTNIQIDNRDLIDGTMQLSQLKLSLFKDGKIPEGRIESLDSLRIYLFEFYPNRKFRDLTLDGALGFEGEFTQGNNFLGDYFLLTRKGDLLHFEIRAANREPWLSYLKAVLNSLAFDDQGPELIGLNVKEVDPEGRITYEIVARDDLSGLAGNPYISTALIQHGEYANRDITQNLPSVTQKVSPQKLSATYKLSKWEGSGDCEVYQIHLYDNADNARVYHLNRETRVFQEYLGSNDAGDSFYRDTDIVAPFFPCTFEGPEDITGPKTFEFRYPKKIAAGEHFNIDVRAEDLVSGIRGYQTTFGFLERTGMIASYNGISVDSLNVEELGGGWYRVKAFAPDYLAPGVYTFFGMYLEDYAGNHESLFINEDGDKTYSDGWNENETGRDTGIPVVQIEVENKGTVDMEGPWISSLEMSNTATVAPGESFQLEIECHDATGTCQLWSERFCFRRKDNKHFDQVCAVGSSASSGRILLDFTVPRFAPQSEYELPLFHLKDANGFLRTYGPMSNSEFLGWRDENAGMHSTKFVAPILNVKR